MQKEFQIIIDTIAGMLQVIGPEFGVLTEGESSSITLRKNFNATFPITLDISFSGQGGFGPPILGDYHTSSA